VKNKSIGHIALVVVLTVLAVAQLSAATPQIILSNIKGKVEVKPLNAAWAPAKDGMVVTTLTTISTGFDSSVTIKMDKNTIYVKPLTRLTVDKLLEAQGTVSTSLYLRTGTVQATVKSAEGVKQEFQVQSPYSTASVRGTDFEYDGLILTVSEGVVAFIPGRPKRDIQMPPGAEGEAPPDLEGDFAGSPDTPAVEGQEFTVPAGFNAELTLNPDGSFQGGTSGDRDSLESGSTVTTSDSGSQASESGDTSQPPQTMQYGTLTVTVTVVEE